MEMLARTLDRCSEGTRFNTFGTHTQKTYEIVAEILQTFIKSAVKINK